VVRDQLSAISFRRLAKSSTCRRRNFEVGKFQKLTDREIAGKYTYRWRFQGFAPPVGVWKWVKLTVAALNPENGNKGTGRKDGYQPLAFNPHFLIDSSL
jgi:hypothetical protein